MCEKTTNVPALFGKMVFGEQQMQQRLPAAAYQKWQQCLAQGTPLDRTTAGEIANAMKDWAIEKGATHYTPWFQPMTGVTAEKHDSFITRDGKDGVVMELSAKELSKGEADASSFPSGGLRATFEARGYTAWDPTSYAFVKDETLYIPTIFCSYSGQTLDKKTPLLRSMRVLDRECIRILRLFGNTEAQHVTPQVGPEQEYFLIDEKVYRQREDLKLCGRTLFGARPSKGQELDDHYYGAIKPRVAAFMRELDQELWKLGVLAKTEHNEVAPAQHEIAPIYSDANSACDKNQLTMELLKKVAARHGLVCLLHEKPFAGVNGSGKHNNWSIVTNTGKNLLNPTDKPEENPVFLVTLCAVLTAVDKYADLLRLSASCPGNEERLGGNEAPPAVVSIFLGNALTHMLQELAEGHALQKEERGALLTGVKSLPLLKLDDSDRNRTSPFAFTGNKFEFRMVGASQSIGLANAVTNAIVADVLHDFADKLEGADDVSAVVREIVAETWHAHGRIIFNGNNYSAEWAAEAARRGLPNIQSMVDAAGGFIAEKNVAMFERTKVFTAAECRSRYEITLETYAKHIHIDASTMLEMAGRSLLPASYEYLSRVSRAEYYAERNGCACASAKAQVEKLCVTIDKTAGAMEALRRALHALDTAHLGEKARADACRALREHEMAALREAADELEELVPQTYWPMPDYCELLFDL